MHLYKTSEGILLHHESQSFLLNMDWDELVNRSRLFEYLLTQMATARAIESAAADRLISRQLMAPVGNQELWAAGVTYLRSRDARMEESKNSGASDCYQLVYDAQRPELFFKALPHRIAAPGQELFIRGDSTWNVPEPELTLLINSLGEIEGYTIGNDMSSRSIEGENPLYLPQAKVYEKSAALGPCLLVLPGPISPDTTISISIRRNEEECFSGAITLNRMKRTFPELAQWLFRGCRFPYGCYLMTGTGLVPPNEFTLAAGDEVLIAVEGIGELRNTVAVLET